MSKTIADLKALAAQIAGETQAAANTAARIGGAVDDAADLIEEAQTTADDAKTAADEAKTAAQTAQQTANSATFTINMAQSGSEATTEIKVFNGTYTLDSTLSYEQVSVQYIDKQGATIRTEVVTLPYTMTISPLDNDADKVVVIATLDAGVGYLSCPITLAGAQELILSTIYRTLKD